MTAEEIKKIIAQGESVNVEFKSCVNEVGQSVYETVCSFLNNSGGYIFIGVSDQGEVLGVNEKNLELMKRNFINVINDPKLFSPKAYVVPEDIELDGKNIIYAKVEKSIYVHHYKNKFYDRNGDADSDVTDHPALMAGLFVRKDAQCYEDRLVPSLELADLDEKTFDYCRKLVKVRNNTHLWIKLSNEEILRSCGLMAKDLTTGQIGIKLAALLLFGSDASLASFASSYRIEGIYRNMSFSRFEQNLVEDTTRYDDRVTIRSNLINAYGTLMEFVYKHLPEKFYLENGTTQRGDLRSNIFREIVANFCVHREYASQAAGFFEIFSDRVITRNITKFTPSLRTGIISIEELENYTKNPLLVKVFRELGWVEELGSGSRNIKKFAPLYYGKSTIEIMNGENFVFSITYSDADDIAKPESQSATNSVNAAGDSVNITGDSVNAADDSVNLTTLDLVAAEEKLFKLLEERQKFLAKAIKNRMVQELVLIYQAGKLDRVTLLQKLEYTSSQMKGDLRVLQQCGLIEYVHKENIYSLAESIIKELG